MEKFKELFKGKRAFLTIPLAGLLGLFFLPITILLLTSWFIYAKVGNPKIKIAGLGIIGLFILLFCTAYIFALTNPVPLKPKTNGNSMETQALSAPTVKGQQTEATSTPNLKKAKVIRVIDGDTISADFDGNQEVIRLIGIDSPETVDPRKPVQCFGQEASQKAKELLLNKTVSLESDPTQGDRDKYNRLLRYVYLEDGTSANKVMIAGGYAHEYTYNLPYKYQVDYKEAEKIARESKTGLWADDACPVTTEPEASTPKTTTPQTTSPPSQDTSYSCAGKTTCGQMTSCAEAYYYLNNCGVSRLDGDKDGIPCETICK